MNELIKKAIKEDLGSGDITTNCLVPKTLRAEAVLIAKEKGVIAGLETAKAVFRYIDAKIRFIPLKKDGAAVKKGEIFARIKGPARGVLSGERLALNYLQRLSGISTLTSKFTELCSGTGAKILDTRKTTPNLRALEKYAVKMGGGTNHRMGLYDAILIKDNHLIAEPDIKKAVEKAKKTGKPVEVEVKNFSELKEALRAMPNRILLDNMTEKKLRKAVKITKEHTNRSGKRIFLEASGGVSLNNIRKIAKTGVDYISVGALTHSPKALDISLEVTKCR